MLIWAHSEWCGVHRLSGDVGVEGTDLTETPGTLAQFGVQPKSDESDIGVLRDRRCARLPLLS
ncbi:hypothetical protein BH683_000685 [Williamsia sp. 1138]|nr:hypothetical protein BH683_000685 [Williamsia sp. 1138]